MPLKIEYIDATAGLTLYALLLNNSNGQAWNPTTLAFSSYTDGSIDNFDIGLSEDVNRAKYYTYTIPSGTISSNIYTVEIYQKIGGSPSKTNDILKAASPVFWNGSGLMDAVVVPRMNDAGFIGTPDVGASITIHLETYDKFGNLANADTTPSYGMYNGTSTVSPPGINSLTNYETGRYNLTFLLTSGYFTPGNLYQMNFSAYMGGTLVGTSRGLRINDITNINASLSGVFDVANQLGYVSGFIREGLSTSGYYTTLSLGAEDQFNGGIMRVYNGSLRGQARIIRDSAVTSGFLQVNKPFSAILSSGTSFLIFPIGGELQN